MSEFLKAVQAAHEAHAQTWQHQQAKAWAAEARARLDKHYRQSPGLQPAPLVLGGDDE